MIHFTYIRWKNFLSTGNVWTEVKLDDKKTTLVVGSNGSGKSTLLDAVCYGLFGKPFRRVNKPELINRVTGKELMVEIEFTLEGHRYKIVRGMRPNVFEVYKTGGLLNQSADVRDYQDVLEKQILKINFKSFCQVVILGSAAFVPFMQLSTGDRRQVVEDLLDLQIFTTMNVLLKGKMSQNDRDLDLCEHEKRLVNEKMKLIKEHVAELQDNQEKLAEEKRDRIAAAQMQILDHDTHVAEKSARIVELERSIADAKDVEASIAKQRKLRTQLQVKMQDARESADFFEKNQECPVCTQPLEEAFRVGKRKDRLKKSSEIDAGLKQLSDLIDKTMARSAEIVKIRDEIYTLRLDIVALESQISTAQHYITELESELSAIRVNAEAVDTGRLVELEDQAKRIETQFNELHEDKKIHAVAYSMLRDAGIKARIIAQYVPVINKLINRYLAALDFVCNFSLNENFEENIRIQGRDGSSYNGFSEGEKFRINIAILFTWRAIARLRNSASTNLLILDEILDGSLDYAGTDEFMKVLGQLTEDNNVFIISHRGDTLMDKFPTTIKFEKNHGFSKMSEAA